MTFAFTQRKSVETEVRRIAGEQLGKALEECSGDAGFGATVHGLRRRCKKLRGLLRLIEPRFDDFATENQALRAAAADLSSTRDAAVMVETLDGLLPSGENGDGIMDASALDALRRDLSGDAGEDPDRSEQQCLLDSFGAALAPVAERAAHWSIDGRGFKCLAPGLELTYSRMRKGMRAARDEKTPEAMHEWRKDTKYHWHHVSLLRHSAPQLLRGRVQLLDQLGELLGDHHNLAVLDDRLPANGADGLRTLLRERQAKLAEDAFALGEQLTAEKPGTLHDRFEQYWQLLPAEK